MIHVFRLYGFMWRLNSWKLVYLRNIHILPTLSGSHLSRRFLSCILFLKKKKKNNTCMIVQEQAHSEKELKFRQIMKYYRSSFWSTMCKRISSPDTQASCSARKPRPTLVFLLERAALTADGPSFPKMPNIPGWIYR